MGNELLPANEAEELARHEDTISRGLETFVEVGVALLSIREKRLYRACHRTFEDYCRDQWGLGRSRVYQLMDAASVVNDIVNSLSTTVDTSRGAEPAELPIPQSEGQVRPLARLEPDQRRQAWGLAVAETPNGQPTARQVEAAVQAITPRVDPDRTIVHVTPIPVEPSPERVATSARIVRTEPEPEPDEDEGDEDRPIQLQPRDQAQADEWARQWNKRFTDWLDFMVSLPRRGGIVGLTRSWPTPRKEQAKEILRELRDVVDQSFKELEEAS